MAAEHIVVVGGGLAGLSAACELLERGCKVTILEKTSNLGGNSSKATCGIAAPGCELQKAAGIQDTGADLVDSPAVVELVKSGAGDVQWLTKALGVNSELVLRATPGHSGIARMIGTKTHFPGAVVTYAAMHILQQIAVAHPGILQIVAQAEVKKLVTSGTKVTGVEYMKGGKMTSLEGQVVIATGGYAGDYTPGGVLASAAPKLMTLPTTNDERASGDGLKLGQQVGAGVAKLDKVQVIPTAAVLPGQEKSQFKVVVSDAICGAGGKLIDASGNRFCDEMASSEVRVDAMAKAKGPFRIVIKAEQAESVQWLCDFYTQRNIMKKFGSVSALANEMKVDPTTLKSTFGSSALFVAQVTPALYSCDGGLTIGLEQSSAGKVLKPDGKVIEGLYAAGEATSSPFTKMWSVSGIPLLYAIYSGRLAGRAAAATAFGGKQTAVTDLQSLIISAIAKPQNTEQASASAKDEKKPEDMTKEELVEAYKALMAAGPPAAPAAPEGPKGISLEELAKHNKKDDAWVAINGDVIDVVKWIPIHPGGEQAICAYLGQDASEEWNMIHKPGTVEKNLVSEGGNGPWLVGKLGAGGGGGAAAAAPAAAGGITMADVEKHSSKTDAWVVINGDVIDVTKWIPIHPGGEQAICAYLGKDASEEWNMIHKPGTVEKNMQHLEIKGKLAGGSSAPPPAAVADDSAPPPEGDGGIGGAVGAVVFLLLNVVKLVLKTIFFTGNLKFALDNNRKGTIRSAIFLITFIIIHALGNFVDMLGGPNELNGEGYLFDRIHWTGAFGYLPDFPFSVVEEYLALALLLHISVALKRSYDITLNYCVYTGRWNMLISGLTILFFLVNHLQDFRFFPDYQMVELRAPPYFVAFDGLLHGRVFYEVDESVAPVKVRDIYSHEVVLFKDLGKVMLYTSCISVFVLHLCMGWKKLVPSDLMQIPKDHVKTVTWLGWVAAAAVAGMYLSVPWYVYFMPPSHVVSA